MVSGWNEHFLLATKLAVPQSYARLVISRSRLHSRLEDGLHCPLIVVSTPAGFGKTTLLGDWLQTFPHAAAWVSLDHNDNDLTRFWEYCVAAMARLFPGLNESVVPVIQTISSIRSAEAVLTLLLNALTEYGQECLLVLDDYQAVTSPSIQHTLAFFIEHLPPCAHVLISTRTEPSLPLARLRVQGKLFELGTEDLRFLMDETTLFLRDSMHLQLATDDAVALMRNTEGWIAGLQLAALSLQGNRNTLDTALFISSFSGTNRYVLNYLTEEVLTNQPADVQQFLLMTSILRRVNASLCNAVTGLQNGETMLTRLEHENLFLSLIDEQGMWYRYHHLFADLLRYKLGQTCPERVSELHQRASGWFEKQGMIMEAIDHAVAASDMEYAAQLIERNAWSLYQQGRSALLYEWLEKLHGRIDLAQHPTVAYFSTLIYLHTGASEQYQEALQCASAGVDERIQPGDLFDLHAYEALFLGDGLQTLHFTQLALEHSHEMTDRSMTHIHRGAAFLLLGDTRQALHEVMLGRHLGIRDRHILAQMMSALYLGDLAHAQGQLVEATNWYHECIQGLGERMLWTYMQACFRLGSIYLEWNEVERAGDILHRAMTFYPGYAQKRIITDGDLLAAHIAFVQGKSDQVTILLDRAETDALRQGGHPLNMARIALLRVRSWLAEGNIDAATSWVKSARLLWTEQQQEEQPLAQVIWSICDARLALAQQQPDVAIHLLLPALTTVRTLEASHYELLIAIVLVLAYTAQGDTRRAKQSLDSVLMLAERGNYQRTLLDEEHVLMPLLSDLYQRQQKRYTGEYQPHTLDYVRSLLQYSGYNAVPRDWTSWQKRGQRSGSAYNQLSERELEVLKLIAEGHSNQQIARTLVVAESTIKTHLNNIYGKLNVNSRLQALTRAHASGILEL